MGELDYSIDAKNIINKFHRVEKLVYVEGDDDIVFWEHLFEIFTEITVEVEAVGGKPELKKYAGSIFSGEGEFLVAMDSDYDDITGFDHHPNILKTYGYAIENTLVTKESVCKILKNICKLPNKEVPFDLCHEWLESLDKKIRPFVLFDLVSTLEQNGVCVLPRASDQFMTSKKSCEICPDAIKKYLDELPVSINDNRILEEEQSITDIGFSYIDILKGHFLFSAIMRFIKVQANSMKKGLSISSGMLYSNLISAFENIFNEDHPHFKYYEDSFLQIETNA
ncbi:MAG: DUF4435 domain-containing protein [Candidatus Reddybacter sp.]